MWGAARGGAKGEGLAGRARGDLGHRVVLTRRRRIGGTVMRGLVWPLSDQSWVRSAPRNQVQAPSHAQTTSRGSCRATTRAGRSAVSVPGCMLRQFSPTRPDAPAAPASPGTLDPSIAPQACPGGPDPPDQPQARDPAVEGSTRVSANSAARPDRACRIERLLLTRELPRLGYTRTRSTAPRG